MSRNRSLPSDFLILSSVSCDPPLAMNHYLTVVVSAAGKEARKEVPDREVVKEAYLNREATIKAGFVGTVGEVNWPQYYDYVNSQTN